ncbi:unnamed protein product [Sphacelaria rigidula]
MRTPRARFHVVLGAAFQSCSRRSRAGWGRGRRLSRGDLIRIKGPYRLEYVIYCPKIPETSFWATGGEGGRGGIPYFGWVGTPLIRWIMTIVGTVLCSTCMNGFSRLVLGLRTSCVCHGCTSGGWGRSSLG